jgi:hypothetical protein
MSLPIDEREAAKAVQWLKTNYGSALFTAVQDTPFSIDNLCGIACQETAYFWLSLLDELSPDEICARCVLDGSGDFKPEENPRTAFPQNTAAFRDRYDASDPGFADMLIAEGMKRAGYEVSPPWIGCTKGTVSFSTIFNL